MSITDLIPKWLTKFFHDPKRIAFILLCLLIIQTYWGVQYREVQKQIRLLSEQRVRFLKERNDYLSKQMNSDQASRITSQTTGHRDSLALEFAEPIRDFQTATDSTKSTKFDSGLVAYFPFSGENTTTTYEYLSFIKRFLKELKSRSTKYTILISLLGIVEIPLIASLIISWRRRKSSDDTIEA